MEEGHLDKNIKQDRCTETYSHPKMEIVFKHNLIKGVIIKIKRVNI